MLYNIFILTSLKNMVSEGQFQQELPLFSGKDSQQPRQIRINGRIN
jgi:hypothetical protein